jgi:hypothetical protein
LDAVDGQPLTAAPTPAEQAALRGSGTHSDDPIFFVTVRDVCATQRGVTVGVHASLPGDVTVRLYAEGGRTFAKRTARVMGDRTVTASAQLRRGRAYWLSVTGQGAGNLSSKPPRQRIVAGSACP